MNITVTPGKLRGSISAIASKSFAHRCLILAAFSDAPTEIVCPDAGRDIDATIRCLTALGANIQRFTWGFRVIPCGTLAGEAVLPCGESGSTLRFLLPVVGALGISCTFLTENRLGLRPLSPLWEVMEQMGCRLHRDGAHRICCCGKLTHGHYTIDGSVSSQFITGLLLGLQLLPKKSTLEITGMLQSASYVDITRETLRAFSLDPVFPGGKTIHSPGTVTVEGDWSNAAFFLTANVLGSDVSVTGLNKVSVQGDRVVTKALDMINEGFAEISAAQIPDLIPALAVAAAAKNGAVFTDIQRLRLKESDRVAAIAAMLTALGITLETTDATMHVFPGQFTGGTIDSVGDHRIAMAAAIASTVANGPVTILGAHCVNKSYPGFWEDFKILGGHYELSIRK